MAVEDQGGRRPAGAVEPQGGGQVQVAHRVAADDQEVLAPQVSHAVFHAARGAQGLLLHKIGQLYPQFGAVPEPLGDHLGHILQGDADIGKAVALEQADDVLHHRLAEERDHGLGPVQGEGSQPGALPSRHDDCFHGKTILSGLIKGDFP